MNYFTRDNKYRKTVLSVNVIFILGNVFYSLAENAKYFHQYLGVAFLVIGRGLLGIGGARLMSRKFLSINIQTWAQTQYSAIFVASTALGFTFGPGGQAFLMYVEPFEILGLKVEKHNIYSYLFIIILTVFLIIQIKFFIGHDNEKLNEIKLEKMRKDERLAKFA